jgi:hypothetical protein
MTGNNTNMLYRLLTGPDSAEFCHKITKALNEGWSLYGDPSMVFDEARGITICAQAVTKQTTEPYDLERRLGDY